MQSKLTSVDDYLQEVPEARKAALHKLRTYCRTHLKGFEESMDYGMPAYKRNGVSEVAFNSQKNYISVYILIKAVLDKYRGQLKNASLGKGCIRYSHPDKIDFSIIKKILTDAARSKNPICPR